METKKTKLKEFMDEVGAIGSKLPDEDAGYIVFAYKETEEGTESAFSSNGKLHYIAECLYSCMKNDPMLANVVMAASNAIAQSRMAEAMIREEQMNKGKRKRTKKTN